MPLELSKGGVEMESPQKRLSGSLALGSGGSSLVDKTIVIKILSLSDTLPCTAGPRIAQFEAGTHVDSNAWTLHLFSSENMNHPKVTKR